MPNQPISDKELLAMQTRGKHTSIPARPAVPHGKACEPERLNTPLGAQSPFPPMVRANSVQKDMLELIYFRFFLLA